MKTKFFKLSFSDQIRYFYVSLFLLVFVLCGSLYLFYANKQISDSEDSTLEYSLQVVESNMEALIENVNDYSKVIAFHEVIQESLQSVKKESLSYEERIALQESIILMAACCDGISSIYLFDGNGESYIAGNIYEIELIRKNLQDAGIYQEVLNRQDVGTSSSLILSYEKEGIQEQQQMISYVRLIRDLDTLEPLGILAMNISTNRIRETFTSVSDQTGMEVAILDEEGKIIMTSSGSEWLETQVFEDTGRDSFQVVSQNGETYKIGKIKGENGSWSIVGGIPRSKTLSEVKQYTVFSVLIVLLGMVLCVMGASFITRRISVPLKNILSSMERVKDGKLERVDVIETNQEIDTLQQHYNQMLDETEKLMGQKVEEQRLRRKYELSLLQAQIKPHFLYNTFDSVCALAMMGRTQDVYTMMQALGQYYRSSLNKGQEIITINEELRIVENYLIIQSFRYDDVFDVVYDVDESVKQYKMIKLILQPFVQNAIYHGFREHDLQGTITIRAKDDGDYVKLQVEDDGMGMPEEKIQELLQNSEKNQGKRFGLYGTMQRIGLYYHQENKKLFDIQSELGEGTVITVWIPKEMGEESC